MTLVKVAACAVAILAASCSGGSTTVPVAGRARIEPAEPRTTSGDAIEQMAIEGDAAYEARREEYARTHSAFSAAYRRWQSANTDEERASARREMAEAQRIEKRYPWALDPVRQELSWQQILDWWPYRPLLRANWFPKGKALERVFAVSERGGTHADPRSEVTSVAVLYEYPPHTADKEGFDELLEAGTLLVEVIFTPQGQADALAAPPPKANPRPVEVRGHAALMTERRPPDYDFSRREVKWKETVPGSGYLSWHITDHADLYSAGETIEFIDRLREVT